MIKFYDTEHGETVTLAELMTEYDTLKAEEATEAEDFGAYLHNCLTENNGTLEVII
jgi:hypothetical protein